MSGKTSSRSRHVYAEQGDNAAGALPDSVDRPFKELRRGLQTALAIVALRRWVFFIPFCLIVSATLVASLYYPRVFVASTRFERRDDPVFMNLPTTEGTGSFTYFRQTLERDMTAPEYMTEVVEKLNLIDDLPRDAEGNLTPESIARCRALGQQLAGQISVYSKERSQHLDLIEVRYTGSDPTIGAKLVEAVKNTYVHRTQLRIRDFLQNQQDWYSARLDEATRRLTQAEARQSRLQMDNPYIDPSNPTLMVERVHELTRDRRELELRRRSLDIDLRAKHQLLETAKLKIRAAQARQRTIMASLPGAATPYERKLAARIAEVNAQIDQMRIERGMKDAHPEIRQLIEDRARLERELILAHQPENRDPTLIGPPDPGDDLINRDPIVAQWQQEAQRTQIAIEALEQQIADIDTRTQITLEGLAKLEQAKDEVSQTQETFARVASEVGLAADRCNRYRTVLAMIGPVLKANDMGRAVQFSEIQPARASALPISPKTSTIIVLALVAGLCAGAVLVVLAEVFDHAFRGSHQVARSLGLGVLETIDVIITTADRRRGFIKRVVLAPTVIGVGLILIAASAGAAYLSLERPDTYQRLKHLPRAALEHLTQRITLPPPPDVPANPDPRGS